MTKDKPLSEEELREENRMLKKALALCINKPLVKKLADATDRIEKGIYITEKEFNQSHPSQRDGSKTDGKNNSEKNHFYSTSGSDTQNQEGDKG